MTLIVPTTNVAFSLGSNTASSDAVMGKSLDDMIKDRRKEQVQTSRRGPKKEDKADRAIATTRAKRQAAVNARRGLSESKKPTPMEIEKEVYRESRKTAVAKERKQQKAAGGKLPPDASARRQRKKADTKKQTPAKGITRPPSKKVVKAAVSAMQEKGFNVPEGMKVVISFEPNAAAAKTPTNKAGTPNKKGGRGNGNNNNNGGNNNANNNNQKKNPKKINNGNNQKNNNNNNGGRRKK